MGLENYFRALRLKKEALDIRDEVIQLLTDNEEREQRFDMQLKSLQGRYNREIGVMKAQIKELMDIYKGLDDNTPEEIYIDSDGDKDISEEEKIRLRSMAGAYFNKSEES